MKGTWGYISVHWHKGKCQLWAKDGVLHLIATLYQCLHIKSSRTLTELQNYSLTMLNEEDYGNPAVHHEWIVFFYWGFQENAPNSNAWKWNINVNSVFWNSEKFHAFLLHPFLNFTVYCFCITWVQNIFSSIGICYFDIYVGWNAPLKCLKYQWSLVYVKAMVVRWNLTHTH